MKKKRKLGRKLLSFLLTLALVLGLVPWISLTAEADGTSIESGILFVNGTDMSTLTLSGTGYVLTCGNGTATLSGNSGAGYTLTLDGFTCNDGGINYRGFDGLTVIIENTNTIGTSILSFGSLNIAGSGTLEIEGKGVTTIHSLGDLTISDSVNITIMKSGTGISCAGDNSKLTLASTGKINVKGTSYGLFSTGEIDITDGNVTAEGGITGIGLKGSLLIGTKAKLIAIGGDKGAIYYDTDSDHRTVQNAIAGVAWTNKEGTTGGQNIAVSSEGQPISIPNIYKKVEFSVSHIHNFTYQTGTGANANKIIATCSADGCTLPEGGAETGNHVATLTIAAPTLTTYGQTGTNISADAVITDTDGIKGDATVKYYKATKNGSNYTKDGEALGAAPTDAGDYVAEITLGTATASVGYTIAKAEADEPK